jgi:hypothetical protein
MKVNQGHPPKPSLSLGPHARVSAGAAGARLGFAALCYSEVLAVTAWRVVWRRTAGRLAALPAEADGDLLLAALRRLVRCILDLNG